MRKVLSFNDIWEDVKRYVVPPELLRLQWVAIARGGVTLAHMLSIRANKRFLVVDPKDEETFWVIEDDSVPVLLIDDVIGTGNTIRAVEERFSNVTTLTYLHDPVNSKVTPDHFIRSTSEYLGLPWEEEAPEEQSNLNEIWGTYN